jgi:hypothetical protein
MMKKLIWFAAIAVAIWYSPLRAQFNLNRLNLPDESPSTWTGMQLGITNINIKYGSPMLKGRDVFADPNVVPKGDKPFPWRAGANENTTFSTSTDVSINGKALPAGTYGLHVIVGETLWTFVFSKNNQQWGSFFYDPKDDVLRVEVTPTEVPKQENLTYTFGVRTNTSTEVALQWGTKRAAFTVGIDLMATVIPSMRYQLTGLDAFNWSGWDAAAQYCLQNNINLEEALKWADQSLTAQGGNTPNFANLGTKAAILTKLGRTADADAVEKQQISIANAQQMLQGVAGSYATNKTKAKNMLDVMTTKFPNGWETANAWGFWYRMEGKPAEAITYYKKAMELTPTQQQKDAFANRIKGLEAQVSNKK